LELGEVLGFALMGLGRMKSVTTIAKLSLKSVVAAANFEGSAEATYLATTRKPNRQTLIKLAIAAASDSF
jgi:hypothetical protein